MQQAPARGQPERVAVEDLDVVDVSVCGLAFVVPFAFGVLVDQLEARERGAGKDQLLGDVGPGGPRGRGAEREADPVADDRPEQEAAQQGQRGVGAGEERRDRHRGQHDKGQWREPAPSGDVGDDDEGDQRGDDQVQGGRVPLVADRPGQGGEDSGELVVQDEHLESLGDRGGQQRTEQGVDQLPPPASHDQVDANDHGDEQHPERAGPREQLQQQAGQPFGRLGQVHLDRARCVDGEVAQGDRDDGDDDEQQGEVGVGGAPHAVWHARLDHLDRARQCLHALIVPQERAPSPTNHRRPAGTELGSRPAAVVTRRYAGRPP